MISSLAAAALRSSRHATVAAARRNIASSATCFDSKYLEESRIPTMHYQDSLPRLPVPDLNKSLDKFLLFAKPLQTEEEYAQTQTIVEDFRNGDGAELYDILVADDNANKNTSFIAGMWYDMYLENRDSFPLNLTPELTWKDSEDPARMEQAVRAADIVHAGVRYFFTLRDNKMEPMVFHMNPKKGKAAWLETLVSLLPSSLAYYPMYLLGEGYALDMFQFNRAFSSTRLPRKGKDELWTNPNVPDYIVVTRRGGIYKVPVLDAKTMQPLPVEQIEGSLRAILADKGNNYESSPPVAALTAWGRDEWAEARAHMEASPVNKASLEEVDGALFALTLDHSSPDGHADDVRAMLHGDCRNRWFDKSFNVMVCENGRAGVAWEHGWGDGVAMLSFFDKVYAAIEKMPARANAEASSAERIGFELDSKTTKAIEAATAANDKLCASISHQVFRSEALRKADVRASGLSPDGVMQMLMQLAHWRAHEYTPSTYESANTAGFKHGRTETIRPASPESVAMTKVWSDPASTTEDKLKALETAIKRHSNTVRQCMTGHGFDRLMFALREHGRRNGKSPAIFESDAYQKLGDIRLSTSTLSSPALLGGGFGPVSLTSYGVGYGIEDEGAQFNIMSYGAAGGCDNDKFIAGLESAMEEMHEVLALKAQQPPADK